MAVEYGGMVSGESLVYGVPLVTWESWSDQTKAKYLEDYNRTQEQQDYHTMEDKSFGYQLGYLYTGIVDILLGTDSAQVGEDTNKAIYETIPEALDTGKDYLWTALLLGGLYLALKD